MPLDAAISASLKGAPPIRNDDLAPPEEKCVERKRARAKQNQRNRYRR